jgi:hypothetical protein
MNQSSRRADPGSLFWGIALIAIGALFLLDRFDVANFGFVIRRFWPLFLIAMGASKLLRRGQTWSGLWLIAIGTWLQLTVLHVFDLDFHSSWPLLLIAIGAGMIIRTFFDVRGRREREDADDGESVEVRHDG